MRAFHIRLLMVLIGLSAGVPDAFSQTPPKPLNEKTVDGITFMPFRPSRTDPEITEFDEPHWIYVPREIVLRHDSMLPADRKELLLWIPGTKPADAKEPPPGKVTRGASHEFCIHAASIGYHVIALSYPNTLSAASCNKDAEAEAFENFRLAIIEGGASTHITVSRTNSIENRLIKLLQCLARRYPQEAWESFLNDDGSIKWSSIAVAGQSQGGGHAALIGIHHSVARVLCFGAPKDYNQALDAPAAWYLKASATPKDLFFAFNHEQDRQGCTPAHQIDNLKALKLDAFGPVTSVDTHPAPFDHSHILMTNYPGSKVDSRTAHGTMISPKNAQLFVPVWTYMLTATAQAK